MVMVLYEYSHVFICSAAVITDPKTRRSKQFAFVIYRDEESTQRALADQTVSINERVCEVFLRGWRGTLKRVVWYFEEGGVLL